LACECEFEQMVVGNLTPGTRGCCLPPFEVVHQKLVDF
jgi:hypothetical protein